MQWASTRRQCTRALGTRRTGGVVTATTLAAPSPRRAGLHGAAPDLRQAATIETMLDWAMLRVDGPVKSASTTRRTWYRWSASVEVK